jgi:3-demethoxyubiquinol 3-hydroxylase
MPSNPSSTASLSRLDRWIAAADNALRTVSGAGHSAQPSPGAAQASACDALLSEADKKRSGALMRVNHVGEICAQALYTAQQLMAQEDALRQQFAQAASEETRHLAWTTERLQALQSRPSLLVPLWYAGAFGIGCAAGLAGRAWSLGFVVETERQVEQHLQSHLSRLPQADTASRAVVQQMQAEEAQHAAAAQSAGAATLPLPLRWAMRGAAKVMTGTAYWV